MSNKHHLPSDEKQHPDELLHVTRKALLPANQALTVNRSLRTVSLLSIDPHGFPMTLTEQHFSLHSMNVFIALLHAYPSYCPYDVLLARLFSWSREECRKQLHADWENAIRPVRRAVNGILKGLRAFGLRVGCLHSAGYVLQAL
jgi:hypothetical protein